MVPLTNDLGVSSKGPDSESNPSLQQSSWGGQSGNYPWASLLLKIPFVQFLEVIFQVITASRKPAWPVYTMAFPFNLPHSPVL